MKPTNLFITLLTGLMLAMTALPASAEHDRTKRNIAFIVRQPDRVKNIATRFHVEPKKLTELNSHLRKRQMVYAGKKLIIPVWLKKRDNVKEHSDFNITDYEVQTDSLDPYIKEDFICMADIEADTMRRIAIDKEIKTLDKRIATLYVRLDSVERADVEASADLSRKQLLQRMREARENHTGHFAVGMEIDSVKQQRTTLIGERSRINARVTDYENLVENASYMAAHPEEGEKKTITIREWGDDMSKTPATETGTKSKK